MTTRTQLVYISTAGRSSGTPGDFRCVVPDGMVQSYPGETMAVRVRDLSMKRSWNTISPVNNSFWLLQDGLTTAVSLPVGTYSVTALADFLALLLPGISVAYDPTTSRLHFTSSTSFGFLFNDPSLLKSAAALMGFAQADAPSGSAFSSTGCVDVTGDYAVFLRSNLQKPRGAALDNMSGSFAASDVLLKVPIEVPAFGTIVWEGLNDDCSEIAGDAINELHVRVTDDVNNPIAVTQDWSLTLEFAFSKPAPDLHRVLQDIRGYSRDTFMLTGLQQTG